MNTISAYYPVKAGRSGKLSILNRFNRWAVSQERNRFGWVATIIALQGCVLAPVTMMAVFAAGLGIIFIMLVVSAMAACLISNLAAMPTKITIPVFFASIAIDVAVTVFAIYMAIAG